MEFPQLIDASLLASFKSCPELCRKVYFEHFKSREPSVHLHAGAAFASGMETTFTAHQRARTPRPPSPRAWGS